jgi:hypothetical protein
MTTSAINVERVGEDGITPKTVVIGTAVQAGPAVKIHVTNSSVISPV